MEIYISIQNALLYNQNCLYIINTNIFHLYIQFYFKRFNI